MKIIIDKSAFHGSKEYSLLVKSEGYSNLIFKLKLFKTDGNLIINGDFSSDLNAWETYGHNDCADFKVENDYLTVHSKYQAMEDNKPISWSVQLGQSEIPVNLGDEYELTFAGYSSIERKIVLEGINNTEINLTTEPQIFRVRFTPDTFDITMKFLMGTVDNLEDKDHFIYLDNISIKEKSKDGSGEGEIKPGSKLEAPSNVFAENAPNGVSIKILPAISTPANARYQIYFDGKLVKTTTDKSYVYETKEIGSHKISVKVLCDDYLDSDLKEISVYLNDIFAPDPPNEFNLSSTAAGSIRIAITPPNDNVGVTGYIIYLDGTIYKDINESNYTLTNIPKGEHLISVMAYDAAGNISTMSNGKLIYVSDQIQGGGGSGSGSGGGGNNIIVTPPSSLSPIWSKALDQIKAAKDMDKGVEITRITIHNNSLLPREIIENMMNKAVDLLIDMVHYKWIIKGDSLRDEKINKEYNLEVKDINDKEELATLQELINKTKESEKVKTLNIVKQLDIAYHGSFPFDATLLLPLDEKYGNKHLYVYDFNIKKNTLEFITMVKADKEAEISIPLSHASKYIITEQALLLPTSEATKTIYTKLKGKIRLQNVSSDAVVTYKTSNKSIATVNSNGLITGKKKGTATITATIKQGGKTYKSKTKVIVKTSVLKFNKKTHKLKVHKSFTFTITNKGYPKQVDWSTTNDSIASITKKGKVTAKKSGTVTVCATVGGKTILHKIKISK